ncbi:hypothetical protein [Streptomyces sp. NPDC090445]|uniref:hypothetical protein n=1 Tax=Streptomyces sp. NPDC090445 TaxID=3365963 RepID=UPI0037FEA199
MIRLADRIRSLAVLDPASDRDTALAVLDAAAAHHAVLDHGGRPGGCPGRRYSGPLDRTRLADLPPAAPVGLLADHARASPRLHIDGLSELDGLTVPEAEALALLAAVGTEGLVLFQDGRPVGFVPWDDLADVLPLPTDEPERSGGGLGGTPMSPARCYVCRHCDPPVRRLPRSGRDLPVCPVDLRHGPMEREAPRC